jgi:hypothetical protein
LFADYRPKFSGGLAITNTTIISCPRKQTRRLKIYMTCFTLQLAIMFAGRYIKTASIVDLDIIHSPVDQQSLENNEGET